MYDNTRTYRHTHIYTYVLRHDAVAHTFITIVHGEILFGKCVTKSNVPPCVLIRKKERRLAEFSVCKGQMYIDVHPSAQLNRHRWILK